MKLSVVMPSHNVGARVNLNILNACSMGRDDVEVIIRDNSANEEKRAFLSQIREKNCTVVSVDDCSGVENHRRLLDIAKGKFVFVVADDDFANAYAIPTILAEIDKIQNSHDIIGTTGVFVMDDTTNSSFVRFNMLNKPTPLERVQSFLGSGSPSIFQYSPIRRDVLENVWGFVSTLPIYLSYHDRLMNCMFLMHGRMTYREQYLYQYYNANWAGEEMCLKTDAAYFRKAGLDSSSVRLQWLIAAFEGAQTFLSKYQSLPLSQTQRQELGACWFGHFFGIFLHSLSRQAEDAKFDTQALRIAEKWRSVGEVNLPKILVDITEHFSLSSPDIAQRYHEFWR